MFHHADAPCVLVVNSSPSWTMPLESKKVHAPWEGAGRLTPGTSPAYIAYCPASAAGAIAAPAARVATRTNAARVLLPRRAGPRSRDRGEPPRWTRRIRPGAVAVEVIGLGF